MRQLILAVVLFAVAAAQSDGQGGWFCNYTATGDEIVQNAVPIYDLRTSGNNATRKNWCIAYCADRTSLKGTINFQPSGPMTSPRFTRIVDMEQGRRTVYKQFNGRTYQQLDEDDDKYCPDQEVAATVDAVFAKYNNIDDYATQLAYYVNRPQWAFLVFELVPDASGLVSTENIIVDNNFCSKVVTKDDDMFQVFSGYVAN